MKLIDTSYFYDVILSKDQALVLDSYVLDLTLYELGNVLWKHYKKLKTISKSDYLTFQNSILDLSLNVIRFDQCDFSAISSLADRFNLTFYDSAYVFYAKKYRLDLLTHDSLMKEAFEKI
jgi:predicted nucleic acid-binding protein